jgi:hypothetical protein
LIPTPADPFDAWFRIPVVVDGADDRFDVRRARPDEFERIYDLVDAAFGRKRPRAAYDWLYLRNPYGRAQCWIVVDRKSGDLLKSGANFPWPIWRGAEPLWGMLAGDSCTAPAWQRKGLTAVRRRFARAHPWYVEQCGIAGPNEGTRIVVTKAGDGQELLGALPGGALVLRAERLIRRIGAPSPIARSAGAAADLVFSAWRRLAFRSGRKASGRIEVVERFTTDFDAVTERCMAWPRFWCPHNADFLNWRFLDHPIESYVALALVENERPVGYAVVGLEREKATLAEFAVDVAPRDRAWKLLAEAARVAREAGCGSLNFFGPPGWRHWPLFRRAGFLPYRTDHHLEAWGRRFEPEVLDLANWQLMPGDRDFR